MTTAQRISSLLEMALTETSHPNRLLDAILAKGIANNLEWYEIVSAVDEAERRTGMQLHPVSYTPHP